MSSQDLLLTPENIAFVEIFPPIGIARVGNSGSIAGQRRENIPVEYFLGPEIPLGTAQPTAGFRDSKGRIKRQAVRYRVFAYNVHGQLLGEINAEKGYTLEWTVDVANTKAATTIFRGRFEEPTTRLRNPDVQPELPEYMRTRLIVKPAAPITASGNNIAPVPIVGKFQGSRETAEQAVTLDMGDVRTDDKGRLIFVGGAGWACCVTQDTGYQPDKQYPTQPDITSEFDNIDWIDDTCDGYIGVSWTHERSLNKRHARHKAYVISGPPNFAWGINAPTTLWDIIEDNYNKASKTFVAPSPVQFERDIWPVLDGTYRLSWTNKTAFQGHGPNGKGNFLPLKGKLKSTEDDARPLRSHVFNRLRQPDLLNPDQATVKFMPRLAGDGGELIAPGTIQTTSSFDNPISQFASLTSLQYQRFKHWAKGDFQTTPYPGNFDDLDNVPPELQPEYLTRAQLESAVGDPVFPGIETWWIAKETRTYHMEYDSGVWPPFRINERKIQPGDMTKGLSLPWQSDFGQCNTIWWPSSRPDDVVPIELFIQAAAGKTPDQAADLTQEQANAIPGLLEETTRRRWTEPMRITPNNDSQFFPGCTDMVRHWQQLGFVARINLPFDAPPVFVEVERKLPERPAAEDLPNAVITASGDVLGRGVGGVGSRGVAGGSAADKGSGTKRKRSSVG